MASDFRITDLRAKDALDNLLTSEASEGLLRIYATAGDPTIPAGEPAAAGHGTLLAELTMHATAFGAAAAAGTGVTITAGTITSDSDANATGTAVYFVLYDSAGTTALCQGTVGTSECDMTIDNTSIAQHATVSCSAFTISLPKGWSTA